MTKGTKVQVGKRHRGAAGSTGRITGKPEKIRGILYYMVRLTGGRAAGMSMRFTAKELIAQ